MIELKANHQEGKNIAISTGMAVKNEIVIDPTLDICTDNDGLLCLIDMEICHGKRYYTGYITDVVNALIPGEYSVPEFGWTDVSAVELFVLLLMKGYNTTEYTDWTDALPDKGERIKQYLKSES